MTTVGDLLAGHHDLLLERLPTDVVEMGTVNLLHEGAFLFFRQESVAASLKMW